MAAGRPNDTEHNVTSGPLGSPTTADVAENKANEALIAEASGLLEAGHRPTVAWTQ